MKKNASLLILVMVLFVSCGGNVDSKREASYPYLEIVNELETSGRTIRTVTLLGYNLSPIYLEVGEKQTFALNNGMIGGYEDVYIIVNFRRDSSFNTYHKSVKVNFESGKTTVITLRGGTYFTMDGTDAYLEVSYK